MPLEEQQLPPPPKKQGVFGFGKAPAPSVDVSGITSDINTVSRRLKLVEEGFTNLRRFLQITEENIISKNKHYSAEIKTINSDIMEIRKELQELRDKMMLIIRELQSVARKEDVMKKLGISSQIFDARLDELGTKVGIGILIRKGSLVFINPEVKKFVE